ncbi:hybrid sensor histidine kinase/response regulator [Marinobacter sp. X15-166B]|uniref:hybrid sensor histidine kinase/response regulator n=1 Tax=Marinobacter sp. X15-166B TaxID=1897620 RepID=UPI00085C0731|nr:ATP-binding protein [Marinobacter sp. X15-166B]OEY67197.1 hybrid sensor histidine kinase/response regulator [Marinobacter sp. X15-166B]
MIDRYNKRLSYRLTRNTVLVAMLLGLTLNLAQVAIDFFNARQAMDNDIEALIGISHSPASQIAYNIDIRLAEELLQGLLNHPAVIDARIIDSEGHTLAAASKRSSDSRFRQLSDALFGPSEFYSDELQVPLLADMKLGQLAITTDTFHYGVQFLQRAGHTILSGIVKSLLLTLALLVIFYLVLTKPLLKVIDALGRVDTDSPEKMRLPTPPGHERDELGRMVSIINRHLDTIDDSLGRLRAAESAMKHYSARLEGEVADRTREISEKNKALQRGNYTLIRTKEEALRKARSRADFLASMSHEIRTPLNGLLGMLELSLEGELSKTQRSRLIVARSAGESLLRLLNDVLDISKVEAGKLNLETIPFSVRAVTEECCILYAPEARRKNIELICDIGPELKEYYLGDPTRTRQIINNLLSNAVKFTNAGEVLVRVRAFQHNLRFDVIDTGIGISSAALNKIFSPFSQAGSDTTRLYGGSGLGLALCRQLVERMHGQILVESDPGQGTHFTVLLPLPPSTPEVSQLAVALPNDVRRNGVALLLPPAHPHQTVLENQLKAWGVPVHGDRTGTAAILMVAPEDPEAPALAADWPGKGVIWVDRSGTYMPPPAHRLLILPLQRQALLDCLNLHSEPRADDRGSGPALHHTAPPAVQKPPAPTGPHLLLVEDNAVNQMVASGILKKLGYTVAIAENGQQALQALRQHHYDLVLMDCQMPVMNGYQATREIRKHDQWADLPIIAVTANVMQGDKDDCLNAGMNDYITKPYKREDLVAVIERWAPRPKQGG